MSKLVDMNGAQFHEGCVVARALERSVISIQKVTAIKDGKLFLDNSNQHIRIPSALLIIAQDPLFKLVSEYKHE